MELRLLHFRLPMQSLLKLCFSLAHLALISSSSVEDVNQRVKNAETKYWYVRSSRNENPRYRSAKTRYKGRQGRIISIDDFGAISDSTIGLPLVHFQEFLSEQMKIEKSSTFSKQSAFLENHEKNVTHISLINTAAFNEALSEAKAGDVVLVPNGHSYTFTGGIVGHNLEDVTIDFAGSAHFVHDLNVWPFHNSTDPSLRGYLPAINIVDSKHITLTCSSDNRARTVVNMRKNEVSLDGKAGSGGVVNGNGKVWWDDAIFNRLPGDVGGSDGRPRLVHIQTSEDVVVENLTLLNSPYWTLTVEAIRAEVHHVSVLVDRKYQTELLASMQPDARIAKAVDDSMEEFFPRDLPDWVGRKLRQPQDLNTDGIDIRGEDIWVHNCIIQNADDSIAVKSRGPYQESEPFPMSCTRNITIEHCVLTGFGASIGSVGPEPNNPCVDDVTFRNITMPGTGKGIYIKSNKSPCNGNMSSTIANILYEDVYMKEPFWWPIWIGPQQQHQPHAKLGGACPLLYPLPGNLHCPTQGCSTFENITLRNIRIQYPLLSPGVILGNETNPIKNLVLKNVTVEESKWKPYHGKWPFNERRYPFRGRYKCQNVEGSCQDCHPAPSCLSNS